MNAKCTVGSLSNTVFITQLHQANDVYVLSDPCWAAARLLVRLFVYFNVLAQLSESRRVV